MEKVRVRQRVNEVCEVCVVERRGLGSDAGRGSRDPYSLCGSGVLSSRGTAAFHTRLVLGGELGEAGALALFLWNLSHGV